MSSDLVKQAAETGLALLAGGQNPFSSLMVEYNVPSGAFLKFSGNTGKYMYKSQEIEHGSTFAFNMLEMRRGWVCWKDQKAVEQHMVRVMDNERPLDRSELVNHGPYKEGEGWFEQVGVPVRDLEGGDQLELNLSSISGRNALVRLADDFGQKVRFNIDKNKQPMVPIVEIGGNSFTSAKAAGTKWAPTFKIVDWVSVDDLAALAAANASGADEDEPMSDPPVDSQQDAAPAAQHTPQAAPAAGAQSKPMASRKIGGRRV